MPSDALFKSSAIVGFSREVTATQNNFELVIMMQAAILEEARSPLVVSQVPIPNPGANQIQLRVRCCGVCRTDLHIVDGELSESKLPLIETHPTSLLNSLMRPSFLPQLVLLSCKPYRTYEKVVPSCVPEFTCQTFPLFPMNSFGESEKWYP